MFLTISISILSVPYNRVDVIGRNDVRFKIKQIFKMPSRNPVMRGYAIFFQTPTLIINNNPKTTTMTCNNREPFTINIENKGERSSENIKFAVENSKNLKFKFPENIIIPPNSIREITFFIDADCANTPQKVTPTLKIEETDIEFTMNIFVENRME